MESLVSKKVYSVSELTYSIKNLLEAQFAFISVKGEISNLRVQSSGHSYFSLKDSSSQLSAVLFKGNARKISKKIKEGDQVILTGEISVYPPRGNYQLIVREIHFLGLGELLLKLHELKKKLKEKGYFNQDKKQKLPAIPTKIGIVTSPTGAVIQDVINVLKRRHPGFHLILNPVKVQGEGSAEEIALAIAEFNKYKLADVLIIGRGGGSLEDLWAFNEEIVADAILQSKIPIISAVGHETDTSIADFVADIRAPTPSAAAEIVIAEKEQLLQNLKNLEKQLKKALFSQIANLRNQLMQIQKQPFLANPYLFISPTAQKLDELQANLDFSIKNILKQNKNLLLYYFKQCQALSPLAQLNLLKQKLNSLRKETTISIKNTLNQKKMAFSPLIFQENLKSNFFKILENKKEKLRNLKKIKNSIDPKNLLKKGYSILFSQKDESIILSFKNLPRDKKFFALLSDGKILAKSEGVVYGEKK